MVASALWVEIAVEIVFVLFSFFYHCSCQLQWHEQWKKQNNRNGSNNIRVIMILIYSWSGSGITLHGHWRSTKSNLTSVLLFAKAVIVALPFIIGWRHHQHKKTLKFWIIDKRAPSSGKKKTPIMQNDTYSLPYRCWAQVEVVLLCL